MEDAFSESSNDFLKPLKGEPKGKRKYSVSRANDSEVKKLPFIREKDISKASRSEQKTKVDKAKHQLEGSGSIMTNKQFQAFKKKFYNIQRDLSQDEKKCIRCKIASIGVNIINSNQITLGSVNKPNNQSFRFEHHRLTHEKTKDPFAHIYLASVSYAFQNLIKEGRIRTNSQIQGRHYAIYAPPGAGKTTLQIELLKRGIFIQDFDLLYDKSIISLETALKYSSVLVNDPSKIRKDIPTLVFSMNEQEFIKRVKTKSGIDEKTLKLWFEETKFEHVQNKFRIDMSNTYLLDWIKVPQESVQIPLEAKREIGQVIENIIKYNAINKEKWKRTTIPSRVCCNEVKDRPRFIKCDLSHLNILDD